MKKKLDFNFLTEQKNKHYTTGGVSKCALCSLKRRLELHLN